LESGLKNDILFVANGAIPGDQNTTLEIFQGNQWIQLEEVVPAMINLFCVAFRDSETIVMAGGSSYSDFSVKTFLLSYKTMTWNIGPDVRRPISFTQCGRIITSRTPIIE
jgi:hypothetical protein